jgi:ABC-type uncharacterized transport system involved in gliding motility auxiliary subunit
MNKTVQFLGILGFVILVFGLIVKGLVVVDEYSLGNIHFILALVLLVFFAVRGGLQFLGSAATRKTANLGAQLTVYYLLFLGLLGVANYFVSKHEFISYDSTKEKVYTLDEQTQKVLSSLTRPIKVRAFFLGKIDAESEGLLNRYKQYSDKFQWEFIDPEKKPHLTEKYEIRAAPTLQIGFDDSESQQGIKIVKTISENELTNAIIKLTRGGEKKVYALTGHGEGDLDSQDELGYLALKESIQDQNLKVEPLFLDRTAKVPDDASALLVVSPKKALLPTEIVAINDYIAGGGSAVFLVDPKTTDDIKNLVKPLGIAIGNDIIVDQVMALFSGPTLGVQPMVNSYGEHPIVKDMAANRSGTVYNTVCSVTKTNDVSVGSVSEIVFTGKNSWAEKNVDRIFSDDPTATLEADDIRGPVSIAAAFEGVVKKDETKSETDPTPEVKSSRVVVFGDSDFVSNVNIRQLYNNELILNAINWAVSQESGVSISIRKWSLSTKVLSAEQFSQIFVLSAIVFPELLLALGLSVWWFRKR